MNDETQPRKVQQDELNALQQEDAGDLTGEEIEKLADLFASAAPDEDEQDTGEFDPVSNEDAGNEDTGPFKTVTD